MDRLGASVGRPLSQAGTGGEVGQAGGVRHGDAGPSDPVSSEYSFEPPHLRRWPRSTVCEHRKPLPVDPRNERAKCNSLGIPTRFEPDDAAKRQCLAPWTIFIEPLKSVEDICEMKKQRSDAESLTIKTMNDDQMWGVLCDGQQGAEATAWSKAALELNRRLLVARVEAT